jgi:thioredoxin-dependent peroxiredoxin
MTLTAGQPAPSFTLPSSDGGALALEDLRGSVVVVYFYPRDNTPGCTIEAQELNAALPALKALGAMVVGVSKDSIKSHCGFRDKLGLGFPLLSDADGAVLTAYGAWGEKMMYGKPMTGIIRSTVILDRDGKVARVFPKVSAKGHAAEVVEAVRALSGGDVAAPAATKSAATKSVATKTAATKSVAKKPAAKKSVATKSVAKKPAAKKPAAKKPTGKTGGRR